MKLIVGLGNPGKKYEKTRHNTGFLVLEELKEQVTNFQFPISNQLSNLNFQTEKRFESEMLRKKEVLLVKPDTFMNESGRAVAKLKNFYKINLDDLYVIHDDLDLKLGEYKIQKGVGPKVHNGVLSVEKELGDKGFWRVRVGIDNRGRKITQSEQSRPESRTVPMSDFSGEDYVLGRFSRQEQEIVDGVIEKIVKEIKEKLCI